jgi:radical SAM superfamily enzyme YgiQ (UPF0313 family)
MIAKDLSPFILKKMVRAGCRHIRWGIESANPKRQSMLSKHLNLREVGSILQWAASVGIKSQVSFTIGYPNESHQDKNLIIGFVSRNRNNIHAANIYRFKPRRGSLAYQYPQKFGIRLHEDFSGRDEVPFDEIDGLDWSAKKREQQAQQKEIGMAFQKLGFATADPEAYFSDLIGRLP